MTLPTHEFIRRFLIHVLPKGVHRIRHYGLFANGNRAANIERARELLAAPAPSEPPETSPRDPRQQPVHSYAVADDAEHRLLASRHRRAFGRPRRPSCLPREPPSCYA